jgi:hypothetical protein
VRNARSVSEGKPEGKRQPGRSTLVWEDNIKNVLKEIGGTV